MPIPACAPGAPVQVLLPGAREPVDLPSGWTADAAAEALSLVVPERDFRVFCLVVGRESQPVAAARAAWQLAEPGFDLPVLAEAEAPATAGWTTVHEITYDTPAREGRFAMAIVRTLENRAYVNLLVGSKAGLSRRLAQIGDVVELWRPAGIATVDLRGRQTQAWTSRESEALASFITDAMATLRIPGVAVAIVERDRVVYTQGFGHTNIADPQAVTPATRFMIGSTTKALTTLMMARLVATGAMAWSTRIADVLPGFSLGDREMTGKLEMHHTVSAGTGMPRRDVEIIFRTKGVSAADRIAEMKTMTPTTGFGETFQYSNHLVALGGYAASRVHVPDGPLETAFATAMHDFVFEPLGMVDSSVDAVPAPNDGDASPHALDLNGSVVPLDFAFERSVDAVAPAGAAWSTADDLARYVLYELSGNAPGERRLPRVKIDSRSDYGLGLFIKRDHGVTTIGHEGNTLGFSADMFFLPEAGIGAVVLTNVRAANAFLAAVRMRIAELVFGTALGAASAISSASSSARRTLDLARKRVQTDATATAWLQAWTGEYWSDELGAARLFRKGDAFRIEFDSWSSEVGSETQQDGSTLLALTSPPWNGSLRLQPREEAQSLVLDAGQVVYTFRRR